jgi:hypothetical protein
MRGEAGVDDMWIDTWTSRREIEWYSATERVLLALADAGSFPERFTKVLDAVRVPVAPRDTEGRTQRIRVEDDSYGNEA